MSEIIHLNGCRFSVVNFVLEFTVSDQASSALLHLVEQSGGGNVYTWSVYPVQAIQLVADRLVLTCTVEQEPAYFVWHIELMCACRIAGLTAAISIGPYTELQHSFGLMVNYSIVSHGVRQRELYFGAELRGSGVNNLALFGNNACIESLDGARCIRVVRRSGHAIYYNWQVGTCVFSSRPNWHSHQPQPEPIQLGGYYVSSEDWSDPHVVNLIDSVTHNGVDAVIMHDSTNSLTEEWDINKLQALVHPPNIRSDPHSSVDVISGVSLGAICATYQQYLYVVKRQRIDCINMHTRDFVTSYYVENEQQGIITAICASKTHLFVCREDCIRAHALSDGQDVAQLTDYRGTYITAEGGMVAWVDYRGVYLYDVHTDRLYSVNLGCRVLTLLIHTDKMIRAVTENGTFDVSMSWYQLRPDDSRIDVQNRWRLFPTSTPGLDWEAIDKNNVRCKLSCDGSRLAFATFPFRDVRVYSYETARTITLVVDDVTTGALSFEFVPARPALLLVYVARTIIFFDADTGTRYTIWSNCLIDSLLAVAPASVTVLHRVSSMAKTVLVPQIPLLAALYIIAAGRRRPRQMGFYLPDELWQLILYEFVAEPCAEDGSCTEL